MTKMMINKAHAPIPNTTIKENDAAEKKQQRTPVKNLQKQENNELLQLSSVNSIEKILQIISEASSSKIKQEQLCSFLTQQLFVRFLN